MIDWGAFVLVAAVSIGSATALVAIFAAGLRLLAVDPARGFVRPLAYACFAVAAIGALYGISLLIPALHH